MSILANALRELIELFVDDGALALAIVAIVVLAALAAFLLVGVAWGHHNMSALFDFNDRVTVTGTLTKVDWRNPHIELGVDMKNGEQVQSWSLEGPPPSFFRARDINRSDVEAALGKTVTAEASRARDGSRSNG